MSGAKTPGQAAQHTYWTTLLNGDEPTVPYDDEPAEYQRAWDASAQAAIDTVPSPVIGATKTTAENVAQFRKALADALNPHAITSAELTATRAERDQARAELAEARAERDRLRAQLAEAVNPAAEDYDNAAEILKLRDLVDEITGDITRKSGIDNPYLLRKAASVRQRAGIEGSTT